MSPTALKSCDANPSPRYWITLLITPGLHVYKHINYLHRRMGANEDTLQDYHCCSVCSHLPYVCSHLTLVKSAKPSSKQSSLKSWTRSTTTLLTEFLLGCAVMKVLVGAKQTENVCCVWEPQITAGIYNKGLLSKISSERKN